MIDGTVPYHQLGVSGSSHSEWDRQRDSSSGMTRGEIGTKFDKAANLDATSVP